jgi:hypothetical protein
VALLPTKAWQACVSEAAERLAALPARDFEYEGTVCKPSPDCMPTATEPAAAGWLRPRRWALAGSAAVLLIGGFPQRA